MKHLGQKTLKVADIQIGERLRQIDAAHAEMLAESLRQTGRLRNRPEVRLQKKGKAVIHTLIAGGHRMRAVEIAGWDEVEVDVYEGTDDEVRLWEIDENLVRHELNPLDRAVFLAERQAIYLRMHPETAAGVAGAEAKHGRANDIMSFAAATAEKCGWTIRTIQRAVSIAEGLRPDVRSRIAGTPLVHKQSELLALIKASHSEQHAILDLLLTEPPQSKTVEAAIKLVRGVRDSANPSAEKALNKLLRAWDDAPPAVQRSFLEHLRGTGQLGAIKEREAA